MDIVLLALPFHNCRTTTTTLFSRSLSSSSSSIPFGLHLAKHHDAAADVPLHRAVKSLASSLLPTSGDQAVRLQFTGEVSGVATRARPSGRRTYQWRESGEVLYGRSTSSQRTDGLRQSWNLELRVSGISVSLHKLTIDIYIQLVLAILCVMKHRFGSLPTHPSQWGEPSGDHLMISHCCDLNSGTSSFQDFRVPNVLSYISSE